MKVVFIQAKSFFTWESLNIGYIAAYLKKHRPDIEIDFFTEFYDSWQTIINGCRNADIIAFSVTSPQYKRSLSLAYELTDANNKIVFGGFHATNLNTKLDFNVIDSIVIGEGEKAFLKLCNDDASEKVYQEEYIDNLDDIPFPDREVIKMSRHLKHVEKQAGKRVSSMLMGRGCPFNCKFCASRSVWGRINRLRSPQNILNEFLEVTEKYNLDYLTFADDEIGVKKNHLLEFCKLKKESGNKIEWGCNMVATAIDDEVAEALLNANCTDIWMGVESGCPEILKDIRKPVSIKSIKRGFSIAKEHGLNRRAYCLIGMPKDSYDTIKMTEDLIDEIEPDIVGFTILAPYPGSDFYNPELHKYVDWSAVDEYGNDITHTRYLSNNELKAEQLRLTNKYKDNITYRQEGQ